MEWLALTDVERVVRLVSEAADPTVEMPVPERKRTLLEGVAKLVSADMWIWSSVAMNPESPGDVMGVSNIDGGWKDDRQRASFYAFLIDPKHRPQQAQLINTCKGQHRTMGMECFAPIYGKQTIDTALNAIGIGQLLYSYYPINESVFSAMALYRRSQEPLFADRDRAIVHVATGQVDWLHRHGMDIPAKENVLKLSPRERQVMISLLGGDSQKEVSRKLELSEHTVGDYVKEIYKHFNVNSRAELLSHFIAGGQR